MNTTKIKIFVIALIWIGFCISMPLHFFSIFENSGKLIQEQINSAKKETKSLQTELDSFEKAKRDLEDLDKQVHQPENFFRGEINVVEQLRILESLGPNLGLTVTTSGLSGTLASATKAETLTNLAKIPYNFTVTGPYERALDFLDIIENLNFIIHTNAVSINPLEAGNVNLTMSAVMFLKKK